MQLKKIGIWMILFVLAKRVILKKTILAKNVQLSNVVFVILLLFVKNALII